MPERPELSKAIFEHAVQIAKEAKANAILVAAGDRPLDGAADALAKVPEDVALLLAVSRNLDGAAPSLPRSSVVHLPELELSRLGAVKIALLLGLSKGVVRPGEVVVCVAGGAGHAFFDAIVVVEVGREREIVGGPGEISLPSIVQPEVFERIIDLATRLSVEGREGRPVGTIIAIGDPEELEPFTKQLVINPFRGYPEAERNILDPKLEETVREFSALDGAFVVRGDGVIVSAGTYLRAGATDTPLEQGLGARHAAGAGVTAATRAIAVVVSSSTGDVRIYMGGELVASIARR